MVSTFTPNIQWEEPARGDQVGTWDTPVNNNGTLIDRVVGAITTIAWINSNVVLSAAQFQSRQIVFNSTLTGSVAITFPASFTKSYEIRSIVTGTSAFTITLQTTVAGGFVICAPPNECVQVYNDGANLLYTNLGRIGSLMDFAGSSVPNWVSGCSPLVPYLNCDGTTFSSAIYPYLSVVLGGNTLPDIRGYARYALNQGTGRLTAGGGGLDGNTNLSQLVRQGVTLVTGNLPAYTPSGTVASSAFSQNQGLNPGAGGTIVATPGSGSNYGIPVTSVFTGNAQGGTSTPFAIIGNGVVVGITMIRSA